MKVMGWVALFVLAIATVLASQLGFLSGKPPIDLGVHNGRLLQPSATANSVSSQAGLYPAHPQRGYADIAALGFTGSSEAAMHKLTAIVKSTERCTLVKQEADYLYAQCSTALLRFTDDVEFWLNAKTNVIELRSASRLGQRDWGVNRARLEKIRAQFAKN